MTVAAIHRYPVKSMLGESLQRCRIGASGVVGDRAYAVIDIETGTVASAKVPKRWAGLLGFSARFVSEPREGAAPPPVEITFPDGSVLRSDDEEIDHALSAALGRAVTLATAPPEGAYFEELWPDIDGLAPQQLIDATETRREDSGEVISRFDISAFGAPGTFFDLSALHVLTSSTLDRLRELAPDATFDARRYRPNVVLRDTDAGFVENDWPGRTATVGTATLRYSFATMRCVMTTLAQGDLPGDADTLRAVAKHNRIEIPQIGGVWACAGVYADVVAPGDVAVGDAHAEAAGQ
ncbi:MOSC N-terminal beta barrel domain-containing protein [Pseudonocardia sp.]|uniref:MOSC domain-containing protein n=1 Tax=Pseudonocardia sp. TaxID=60912 RepID=UPI00260E9140|nr:MOSC N-terminal beta barrel domain-containing protein [Pseudonocardia sp.]